MNHSVGVYDLEINLRVRLIEDDTTVNGDPDGLLDMVLNMLCCGGDEDLETTTAEIKAQLVSEMEASPKMRKQLLLARNLPA
ncbi:MAG: Npun_R1517 family heterocyst differentiation transcriptional regulator [Prochlorotrichaceae cyanobacterium]|jgi:hypothetical protein